ncbi:MAG TPA: hypothetical protein VKK06_06515 [Terriglobia bacterium]|nr:hypothetical protein [Terriglobia bacterium]
MIKPGRASEQIKLDLAQLDPSKMRFFLKLKLSWRFQAVLDKMGDQDQSTLIFQRQPKAD